MGIPDSPYLRFYRIQSDLGKPAAIAYVDSLDEVGKRAIIDGLQELILSEYVSDRSLSTKELLRILETWPIRTDWRLVFSARVAALEGNVEKIAECYGGYIHLMDSDDPPDLLYAGAAAFHFGICFEQVGDLDAAIESYQQCLNILGGVGGHSECSERLASLQRSQGTTLLNSTGSDDPFSVLGLDSHATDAEIKKAYHEIVARFHPDLVATMGEEIKMLAESKTKAINEAYGQIKAMRREAV